MRPVPRRHGAVVQGTGQPITGPAPAAGARFSPPLNVGVFPVPRYPAIVPDMFRSLDVQ